MEHVLLLPNVMKKEELLVETVLLGKCTESSINAAFLIKEFALAENTVQYFI